MNKDKLQHHFKHFGKIKHEKIFVKREITEIESKLKDFDTSN